MTLITTPEATRIIGCAMHVHSELGPGLFESVYEECLSHALRKAGLAFLIVEDSVLVGVKSLETVLPLHRAQVQTYLRLSGLQKGLLINFNVDRLKNGISSFLSVPPSPSVPPCEPDAFLDS